MTKYDVILQIGKKLQASDITTMSTTNLFQVLRRTTNVQSNKTLRHYAKILKEEGFIRFNNQGVWEIIRS